MPICYNNHKNMVEEMHLLQKHGSLQGRREWDRELWWWGQGVSVYLQHIFLQVEILRKVGENIW